MYEGVEHYDPVDQDNYLALQHIGRYEFAKRYLQPKQRVLDIACGSGFGTKILCDYGCDVVGADYDCDLIDVASQRYGDQRFEVADVLDLPFEDGEFDSVVSFETIEHVDNGARFLTEMHRVLRPGGVFICSTPNISYTVHPPYHLKEYQPQEFFKVVSERFENVLRYGQYYRFLDRMCDEYSWRLRNKLSKYLRPQRVVLRFFDAVFLGMKAIPKDKHSYYQVTEYRTAFLLRIMVAVASKQRRDT